MKILTLSTGKKFIFWNDGEQLTSIQPLPQTRKIELGTQDQWEYLSIPAYLRGFADKKVETKEQK